MGLSWFEFLAYDFKEIVQFLRSVFNFFPSVIYNLLFFCPALILVWTLVRYVRELRS